jgi:hypothetical protein
MTHTAAQITAAQQAGNKAWARAYGLGKDPEQCADAYRAALEAEYANSATPAGWFQNPAVTLLDPDMQALLDKHNASVDERKRNGDQRSGGPTFISLLEQAQREGKV